MEEINGEKKAASGIPEGLTPSEIVSRLDNYIIGQNKAKRFVAVALRNRQRRIKLPEDIRDEVAPKNILMIGPTGVGKTEIARRLAKLCGAPFLKVEATKYTEVGYVGRDVESMVRDLMAVGYNMVKAETQETLRAKAEPMVEDELLDLLLPGSSGKNSKKKRKSDGGPGVNVLGNIFGDSSSPVHGSVIRIGVPVNDGSGMAEQEEVQEEKKDSEPDKNGDMAATREKFRQMLREGKLEDREVDVTVRHQPRVGMEMFSGGNPADFEEGISSLQEMFNGGRVHKKSVTVREARQIIMEDVLDRITDMDKVAEEAKKRVEQSGIIFIDEIDKIATKGGEGDRQAVSREGVQRDILPIVEGSNVNTKWGVVNTTHILFIGAGAFSLSAPSDLIPELQGRFPLRVELEALTKEDFKRILTEPKNALIKQYEALLGTEGVNLSFSEEAIEQMAYIAEDVNSRTENIGARRLHTIMETVLEELSFSADQHAGESVVIDKAFVDERMKGVVQDQNLQRYIL
ncbi:MAG: ATP-dependent protease ATPase subunit HslU [Treponema sp.]|nr:ATP-dependent protease ATPase subunit HslU [Treponema sp.]MBQ2552788.1 ATP-dependent protease ATPase subunit HslU [Treponema sp.]MBQ4237262.1 ATP-dependent protease ATPase subunit HslU [Treponema sp.]MBQ5383392.1 ATP-dependent protease ATPase subunit HslU [Treponema sp.]